MESKSPRYPPGMRLWLCCYNYKLKRAHLAACVKVVLGAFLFCCFKGLTVESTFPVATFYLVPFKPKNHEALFSHTLANYSLFYNLS